MSEQQDIKFGEVVALCGPDDGGYILGDDGITDSVFLDSEEYITSPVFSLSNPLPPAPGAHQPVEQSDRALRCLQVHRLSGCLFVIVQKFQYSAAKAFSKKLRGEEYAYLKLTADT